jgi:hypothetical protein
MSCSSPSECVLGRIGVHLALFKPLSFSLGLMQFGYAHLPPFFNPVLLVTV